MRQMSMLNVVSSLQDRGAQLLRARRLAARAPEAEPEERDLLDEEFGRGLRPPEASPRRSTTVRVSFLLCVALPTVLASLYYGFFASNQYFSEFKFSVQASDAQPAGNNAASAALGGQAKAGAFLYNFAVIEFVKSRQAIDNVEKIVGLRSRYTTSIADYLARLPGTASIENFVNYWQGMIDATFDMTTGVGVVRVRAFTPQDALDVANALMRQSEALVNEVAQRSRDDAIRFAEEDLGRAEQRLKKVRHDLLEFRNFQRTADPGRDASNVMDLGAKLRGDLAQLRSQLATASVSMAPNAPTITQLKTKIRSTEEQLRAAASEIGGGGQAADGKLYAAQLARYEDLQVERQFAEQLWSANLNALETAKSNAIMQHTYLAAFVQPALAEESIYPKRLLNIALVFGASALFWMCGLLIYYSLRDRVA
ncbi:hypothetical protein [Methylocella sp.]|uniref:hypothetical protein n=1 Tax=Methylocella sp. TaxID=1978226 RepID=UPI0035AF70D8